MVRHSLNLAALTLLCLCLMSPSTHAADQTRPPSPFAATGLLAHPGETAEEILVRAHRFDTRAMLLTVTGYSQGMGGFPKSRYLAAMWGAQLTYLGAAEFLPAASLQLWSESKEIAPENLPQRLADCSLARETPWFDLFAASGVFDAKAFCDQWEAEKDRRPGWEEAYKRRIQERKSLKDAARKTMALMRELRLRPATVADMEYLRDNGLALEIARFRDAAAQAPDQDIIARALLFYAATTHDPDKEAPDWSASRLLEFIDTQYKAIISGNAVDDLPGLAALVAAGGEAFRTAMYSRIKPPSGITGLIRAAHDGNLGAAYIMADTYRGGGSGFIKDVTLANAWLQHTALGGNTHCMLLLAADQLAAGGSVVAWAWAYIAEQVEVKDADLKSLARQMRLIAETRLSEEQMPKAKALALIFLREHDEWIERHKASQKGSASPTP